MKAPKILFFVDGMVPTAEDMIEAADITGQVCFRNVRAVPAEGSLEDCDGVAGQVPAMYAALPTAAEAIKAHVAKLKAVATKVGDSPAPVAPVKAAKVAAAPKADAAAPTAQAGAGAGEPAVDPAKEVAPGVAPSGAAGVAWKSNN